MAQTMSQTGKGTNWYEYIVVGCGGIGSGAAYWLARRTQSSVLGLEQFKLGHDNGGSQDHSRIIRLSYSDPMYTHLAKGAYECWDEVERDSGIQLVYKTGGINFSRRGGEGEDLVELYAESMDKHGVKYERLDGLRLHERFPQFSASENYRAIYQKDSGLVAAALANATHIQMARKHGATILEETRVTAIGRSEQGGLQVFTNRGTFYCRCIVITAGAWANSVLNSVGVHLPLTVTQEQVVYFATPNTKEFTKSKYPVWIYHPDVGDNDVYGMPIHGNSGPKIGIDVGGEVVTAETRTFIPNQKVVQQCIEFAREHVPRSIGPILQVKTCLYTLPPDRNFVIDTCHRTSFPDVAICCGAGHAFKFASVLGSALSDLVTDGRTDYDIKGFTLNRKALTNPDFKHSFKMGVNTEASKL